ncbi:MAG: 16S rRNA (cytosine(1402)-N(4))-methyltransferase, partial [Candidatus Marinimicrobia bacterium]|nr:16S rRNA (cytosine(1402)-N(4))-methyltransferase [Candidatus Neomarinimicrobiota bacterium]
MDKKVPSHKSVMMNEVLEILNPKSNETYIDCTLGAGGHTRAILESAKCHVIGIDRDPIVFSMNEDLYKHYGDRLTLIKGRFGELKNHIFNIGIKKVDAIFID